MVGWIILSVIVLLAVNLIGAYLMSQAAAEKGYTDINAMLICFLLGIFGYLYIISLPDKRLRQAVEEQNRLLKKQTPSSDATVFSDELPDL